MPLHIPADGVRAHLEADPFLAELLKRLEAGGRLDVMQARHYLMLAVCCGNTVGEMSCARHSHMHLGAAAESLSHHGT